MFKKIYLDVIKNKSELAEINKELKTLRNQYEEVKIKKETLENSFKERRNFLEEKIEAVTNEYSENKTKNQLLLEKISHNRDRVNKTVKVLENNKLENEKNTKLLKDLITFQEQAKNKLEVLKKYLEIDSQTDNEQAVHDIEYSSTVDNNYIPPLFKNIEEYLIIENKISPMIKQVIDENLNECYLWAFLKNFNEENLLKERGTIGRYDYPKDTTPFIRLFKAMRNIIPNLTKKTFGEFVKFQFLISEHKKMLVEFNLARLDESKGKDFITSLIDLYGEEIHEWNFVVFISTELYYRSIGWQYRSVSEFRDQLREYYDNYKVNELLENNKLNSNKGNNEFSFDALKNMSGLAFEDYLVRLFRALGYGVQHTKASGDQGADLLITKSNIKYAVQAKLYTGSVGNIAVQEVLSGKGFYDCDSAIVVTNSTFTNSAIELAEKTNVILWDEKVLRNLIEQANLNSDYGVNKTFDNYWKLYVRRGTRYIIDQLQFKNYLLDNNEAKIEYEQSELNLLKRNKNDKHQYTESKMDFVENIIVKL